jgi:hypothetical protein
LDTVDDPRHRRGKRWDLDVLLGMVLAGMLCGCKSLLDVEKLSELMSRAARRLLGMDRRVPDTTMRTLLCSLLPEAIRALLHRQIRSAHRRKALHPELPISMVAIDGKHTSLPSCDDHYAQRQTADDGSLLGVLRTMTCCLVSSAGHPCMDAIPVHADTNEMATFPLCLSELMREYGNLDLFRLVAADAGSCSLENASLARSYRLHYLFGLKNTQPTLLAEARRLLGCVPVERADASSEDHLSGARTVVRRLYLTAQMAGFGWEHLQTVLRIESQTFAYGQCVHEENRYYVCSLASDRLTPAQWLAQVRRYWMVENGPHWTLDVAFEEDDHPWIEASPQGALAVALLRRVACNMLSLFRSVTLRSETSRAVPWKELIGSLHAALLTATVQDLFRLRDRAAVSCTATASQPAPC